MMKKSIYIFTAVFFLALAACNVSKKIQESEKEKENIEEIGRASCRERV